MAEVVRKLRFVTVQGGAEIPGLELLDDGTVRTEYKGGAAYGALQTHLREFGGTEAEAFAWFAKWGWTNVNTMIPLDDLDPQT